MGFEPTQEEIRVKEALRVQGEIRGVIVNPHIAPEVAESVYASWHELGKKPIPARTPLPRKPMTQHICSTQFGSGAGYNGVTYTAKSPTSKDYYYHEKRQVVVRSIDGHGSYQIKNSHIPMEDGGVCKIRVSTGHQSYHQSQKTVNLPIEYERTSEQLSIDTFWINVARGYSVLERIKAVGGAETKTELIHKELIQSPVYIAEQKRIADEKAVEEQRLLNIKLNEEKIAKLEQKLVEIEEQNKLVELRKLEYERIQTQNLLEAEKQIEVDIQNKKKTIGTALLIGGIGLGLFALSKRKSFKYQ
jgi:hypothetical protein